MLGVRAWDLAGFLGVQCCGTPCRSLWAVVLCKLFPFSSYIRGYVGLGFIAYICWLGFLWGWYWFLYEPFCCGIFLLLMLCGGIRAWIRYSEILLVLLDTPRAVTWADSYSYRICYLWWSTLWVGGYLPGFVYSVLSTGCPPHSGWRQGRGQVMQ